jgi:hypothetical protein
MGVDFFVKMAKKKPQKPQAPSSPKHGKEAAKSCADFFFMEAIKKAAKAAS